MFFGIFVGRRDRRLSNIERQQAVTREAIQKLNSTVASLRADYDAKFALIGQSAADTQDRINAAVEAATKAKEDEDDEAFDQATSELTSILASHVTTVTDNTPPAAPAAPEADEKPQPDDAVQG